MNKIEAKAGAIDKIIIESRSGSDFILTIDEARMLQNQLDFAIKELIEKGKNK